MTGRLPPIPRYAAVAAVLSGLLLISSRAPAVPAPGKQDPLVVQMVCKFLQEAHVNRPEIGDEVAKRLFKRFLKSLDPAKGYFLQSDVDEFKKQETDLDDLLLKGDIGFAYKVYTRLVERVGQRLKTIEELINAPHDFTVKESMNTDFDTLEYAKDDGELRERWRKRVKYELLLQRLEAKPLPEAEAKKKVLSRYQGLLRRLKEMDNYDLMELYLSDLTFSLDPHSSYMSPATLEDFDIAMRLNLEGIGAVLRSEEGQTIVTEVVAGGAAASDGRLKVNDKIIGVAQGDDEFTDVVDMKLREVVKLIRGHRGTRVQLKVIPAAKPEPVVYALTRQTIQLKDQEARSEVIEQGKKADGQPYRVGVIDLPSFYADMSRRGGGERKSATEDVRKILKDFNAKNVDGVVLDLRANGGGALTEAITLTGLFIDRGPVVQVKGFQGRVQRYDDPEKGTAYDGPLVVLVSKLSASASEILAGALQDYGRALVVGDSTTHGKGTVQMVLDLGNQLRPSNPPKLGALKLTIQQFYRVNGDSTQNRGVASDIVLPSKTEPAKGEKELEYALPFDRVTAVEHEQSNMISPELKAILKKRSAERVKGSEEFAKLTAEAALIKSRLDRKTVPLNEQELKAQKDELEKLEKKDDKPADDKKKPTGEPYKFTRDATGLEILHIMGDLMQKNQLLTAK